MSNQKDHIPRIASVAFAVTLFVTVSYFLVWGFDYTQGNFPTLFVLATLFGVFMAFNIGGNDVANSFGTSVGAGTLTVPQALGVAAVFEVSGAVIAGGEVTKTIRSGIVDLQALHIQPLDFVFIMMAALLAAALWLLFATKKGWPVSTTHSIIGGIVGASLALGVMVATDGVSSLDLVQWRKIGEIAISWVLSPVLGGAMAFILYRQIKIYVLDYNERVDAELKDIKKAKKAHKEQYRTRFEAMSEHEKVIAASAMARDAQTYGERENNEDELELESEYYKGIYALDKRRQSLDAHKALQHWVPLISSVGIMMIAAMLLFKGLNNLKLGLSTLHNFLIIIMVGALIWMGTYIYARTLKHKDLVKSTFIIFSWMQVFTAAGFAFSHGANDIANAIGPFAAILDVLRTGEISSQAAVPPIVMVTFGIALVVGLWFIGKEVIQTVGTNLAEMHPASGFTAELSAATIVMLASLLGLPVSSTHILVGAVLGIGIVNRNANWKLMKPIATAWVVTLPSAAVLSVVIFLGLRAVF
ncbi:inorganic phosphate transporter [Pelistega europaea]|uniref:Phosphate transporter n=1 Tax=Pelistega europaea TaxID=106147 RepID=A0A7Y4LBG0_9BURK|nr:inorganic phosphate transporter [Pelistega europaea]NOL50448.1 inorganic phosphate transporter [Pelistega europaea]